MKGFILTAITAAEKCTLVLDLTEILTVLFEQIKEDQGHRRTGSWSVLEECVRGNYYARFHTHICHCYREMHFNSRLNINCDKVS